LKVLHPHDRVRAKMEIQMAKTDPMAAKPKVEFLDRVPTGWFVMDVMREHARRKQDWAALVIDVDPEQFEKYAICDAHHGWFRIPGNHGRREAAWGALEELMTTRH
jgi:hypothetical protein